MYEEEGGGWLWWIIGIVVTFWLLGKVFPTKYEGQTAKEWYYEYDYENGRYEDLQAEYDEFRSCVEDNYEDPHDVYYYCL